MARYSEETRKKINKEKEKLYKWFRQIDKDKKVSLKQMINSSNIVIYSNLFQVIYHPDTAKQISIEKLEEVKNDVKRQLKEIIKLYK